MVTYQNYELFSLAIDLMRTCPLSNDSEIVSQLVNMGIVPSYAKLLVQFLPMVYCRLLLRDTGVSFPDSFCRMLPDGSISSEQSFNSEPIWHAAVGFARREVSRGISADDLLSIAGRSPEFDAANQLLQRGCPLEDIALTPPVLKIS